MARTKTEDKPTDDLVSKGQENDLGTPPALDKSGDQLAAPGEAAPKENVKRYKTTGPFLVHDPYTLDCVGEDGGEMRTTTFVKAKLAEGKLEEA